MQTEIKRIDRYDDKRFSKKILQQHGAFIIDGNVPCSVEITGADTALIHCNNPRYYVLLINEFRFYAEHIVKFYDESGALIKEFPSVEIFDVVLNGIQPSQFFVDEDKINAVKNFVNCPDDIIIPLQRLDGKCVSLDGHTRLALAVQRGYNSVKAFISQSDVNIAAFVSEAQKRGILSPLHLKVVSHSEYDILWNKFCDDFFAGEA